MKFYIDSKGLTRLKARAIQGDAGAQNELGVAHIGGLGVKKEYTEAAKWFTKSAEQGHVYAQYNLEYLATIIRTSL